MRTALVRSPNCKCPSKTLVVTEGRQFEVSAHFVSGYDTPEIRDSKCAEELELGRAAKNRMNELLETSGIQIFDSGKVDKTRSKRPLVWIKLPNGVTVGHILMNEGMARRWTPSYKADWCAN